MSDQSLPGGCPAALVACLQLILPMASPHDLLRAGFLLSSRKRTLVGVLGRVVRLARCLTSLVACAAPQSAGGCPQGSLGLSVRLGCRLQRYIDQGAFLAGLGIQLRQRPLHWLACHLGTEIPDPSIAGSQGIEGRLRLRALAERSASTATGRPSRQRCSASEEGSSGVCRHTWGGSARMARSGRSV